MRIIFLSLFFLVISQANILLLKQADAKIVITKSDNNHIAILTTKGKFNLNINRPYYIEFDKKRKVRVLDYSTTNKHTLIGYHHDKDLVELDDDFQILYKIPMDGWIKIAKFNKHLAIVIPNNAGFYLYSNVRNKKMKSKLYDDSGYEWELNGFSRSSAYTTSFASDNSFYLYSAYSGIGFSRTDNSGSKALQSEAIKGKRSNLSKRITIHPNSKKFYIGGADGKLYIYDVTKKRSFTYEGKYQEFDIGKPWFKLNKSLPFTKNPLEYVTLNQNGSKLLVADKNELLIINSKSYTIENRLKIDKDFKATRYDFLTNNKAILGYNKNKVLLKNIKTGKTYAQIQVYKDGTYIIKDDQGHYQSNKKNTPYIQIKEDDGSLRDLKESERDRYFKDDLIKKLIFDVED